MENVAFENGRAARRQNLNTRAPYAYGSRNFKDFISGYEEEAYLDENVVMACLAYDVVKGKAPTIGRFPENTIEVRSGDTLAFIYKTNRGDDLATIMEAGSVVSYALKNNECPIDAYNRAVEQKHQTHYLFTKAVSITSGLSEREVHVNIEDGQHIWFEGRLFLVSVNKNGAILDQVPHNPFPKA